MAIELFGPDIGPYAAVACVISFLLTGHRSVYPSRILSLTKSSSLVVEHGREMKNSRDVEFKPRTGSLSDRVVKGFKTIKKKRT